MRRKLAEANADVCDADHPTFASNSVASAKLRERIPQDLKPLWQENVHCPLNIFSVIGRRGRRKYLLGRERSAQACCVSFVPGAAAAFSLLLPAANPVRRVKGRQPSCIVPALSGSFGPGKVSRWTLLRFRTIRSCKLRIFEDPVFVNRNGNTPCTRQAKPPQIMVKEKPRADRRCSP